MKLRVVSLQTLVQFFTKMESLSKFILFCLFLCHFLIYTTDGTSFEEDLKLTLPEKQALDKFAKRVRPILPHAYQRTEAFLVRWLRARNFNSEAAEQMLKNNLRWRREQRIDNILNEDFSSMRTDYPFHSDGFDKEGRPVGTCSLGVWNIRQMALAGEMPKLQRYLSRILERGMQLVVNEQHKGNNVTKYQIIINLEGFNQIQHACPICLPAYTNFVSNYENNYPEYLEEIVHINTPPVYDIVLNLIRPLFSPATRKAMKIFGTDKTQWMKHLDKTISRDQRRVEFGGTRKD